MKVKLENVRLSFPALFEPKGFKDNPDLKFSAQFLLDKVKDVAQINALREKVTAVAKEKWTKGIPKGVKYCVGDGDEKDYESHQGHIYIAASSHADYPPSVVDGQLRAVPKDQARKLYAGCYVNAYISLWAQDNDFGKRINANLLGVQFVKDGEPFGQKPFNPLEEFEAIQPTDDGGSSTPSAESPVSDDAWIGDPPF